MSPAATHKAGAAPGFPRVSGDEPAFVAAETGAALFSPRERG